MVPVFNEAPSVALVLARVRAVAVVTEIVAVDDGSTYGSDRILERLRAEGLVDVLVRHPRNRGKGAAVRAGIARATSEIIVVQDADLEYAPFELPRLMEPILDGRADAVFGSRFLGGPHRVMYFWHRAGNTVLTLLSNVLTDLNLSDSPPRGCGRCGYDGGLVDDGSGRAGGSLRSAGHGGQRVGRR